MELIKGNGQKRTSCRDCGELITSADYKYKSVEGYYCFYDGRIKRLHDGVMNWISQAIKKPLN
jgi:hypothetical protein